MPTDGQECRLKNKTKPNRKKTESPRLKNSRAQRDNCPHDCREKTKRRNDKEMSIHLKATLRSSLSLGNRFAVGSSIVRNKCPACPSRRLSPLLHANPATPQTLLPCPDRPPRKAGRSHRDCRCCGEHEALSAPPLLARVHARRKPVSICRNRLLGDEPLRISLLDLRFFGRVCCLAQKESMPFKI